jgi:hypothetical protein
MPKHLEDLRDELISKARTGETTPEIAEAQAKDAGLPPLASTPDLVEFDPMRESRWTLVMVIVWIAWRDLNHVAEQQANYRERSTHWIFREWKQPSNDGKKFTRQEGWFLEVWHPANFLRLLLEHEYLRSTGELPATSEYSPADAELELRRALSDAKLKAEGFNRNGDLVEIPAREWARLQRFQERDRDVFKYNAIDHDEPYKEILFQRDELIALWPSPEPKSKSEVDCRRWLAGLMRESLLRRTHTKSQLRKQALRKFKPMSARQFDSAWNRAIEETGAVDWKKAGRTPAKSNHRTK